MTKRHFRFMAACRDDFYIFFLLLSSSLYRRNFITYFLYLYSKENASFFKQQQHTREQGAEAFFPFCSIAIKFNVWFFFGMASESRARRSLTKRGAATENRGVRRGLGPFHQTIVMGKNSWRH